MLKKPNRPRHGQRTIQKFRRRRSGDGAVSPDSDDGEPPRAREHISTEDCKKTTKSRQTSFKSASVLLPTLGLQGRSDTSTANPAAHPTARRLLPRCSSPRGARRRMNALSRQPPRLGKVPAEQRPLAGLAGGLAGHLLSDLSLLQYCTVHSRKLRYKTKTVEAPSK